MPNLGLDLIMLMVMDTFEEIPSILKGPNMINSDLANLSATSMPFVFTDHNFKLCSLARVESLLCCLIS